MIKRALVIAAVLGGLYGLVGNSLANTGSEAISKRQAQIEQALEG